ncbi:MAG: DUF4982 domain-containing protein [Bacteroidaceae bacterium]|nr:DUF4982 domain-containing protein [Bacteroidaceae bacterium]
MRQTALILLSVLSLLCASARERLSFNADWQIHYPEKALLHAGQTRSVTLPRAWNEGWAYRVGIHDLPDDTCRYTKTFTAPHQWAGKHVFIEFEGARQSAEVWLNGHRIGLHQNGVMAFGFELTPYLRLGEENRLEVLTDNDWAYKERLDDGTERRTPEGVLPIKDGNGLPGNLLAPTSFQWNNKNFNMNMGGLPKNVWLHVTGDVYQTLPLYSSLGTTGTYIYGTDYDIAGKKVTANVQAQVINASPTPRRVALQVSIRDNDGRQVARFRGKAQPVAAGDTVMLTAQKRLSQVHFWSWGYGYLYTVETELVTDASPRGSKATLGGDSKEGDADKVVIRTGFRKTRFGEGKVWLNDRVMMIHGYAQRTSNEWPGVGIDVPAWLSDYSNDLMVQSGANLVRWMHVTPSKQDVESCDRVGLLQAMPAGDAEKDVTGRHWEQRKELMRDAIIYNRNNPSIVFYEGGNESISREHMKELVAIRNQYDPHGGRAIGSREMLDIDEAEYGGEMLYINKSAKHPMWAMEYCRDEGYRMYWDDYSYPYHRQGAGPYYRNAPADAYNQNQDQLAIEQIRRWHDYYVVRPGMGRRVSSGGVKIIFSDTNTHGRSEMNYRTSGVVDAMRIPKDAFFAHQVMWDSWVDVEHKASYIIGHWNYPAGVVKDVYVVSTSPVVELFVNGQSVGKSDTPQYTFLHTFKEVAYQPGEVRAVSYAADGQTVESEARHTTAGQAHHLRLTLMQNPVGGMKADGSDVALVQVEVVDKEDQRLPLDNRFIHWTLEGEGEWRGGIGKSPDGDNYILSKDLPVEAGVSRVLVRSTTTPGRICLTARAKDLDDATLEWETTPLALGATRGLLAEPAQMLPSSLRRGETPDGPSYTEKKRTVAIVAATANAHADEVQKSWDDNELSEWRNDGRISTAWITYELAAPAAVDEISLKLTGWRQRSYPLEVLADDKVVWRGNTEKSLGYVSLFIDQPVVAQRYTIRQTGSASDKEAFGQVTELEEQAKNGASTAELDLYKTPGSEQVKGDLRIVEIDFLTYIKPLSN